MALRLREGFSPEEERLLIIDMKATVDPMWQRLRGERDAMDARVDDDILDMQTALDNFLKSSFHYSRDDGTYELPGYDLVKYLAVLLSTTSAEEVEEDKIKGTWVENLERQFNDFDGIQPIEKPDYIHDSITLLHHQLQGVAEGLARLKKHNAFVLTDEMGLGKTIQSLMVALNLLLEFPRDCVMGGILIVVPAATITGWEYHLQNFFQGPNSPSYVIAHRAWTSPKGSGFVMSFFDMCEYDIVICTINALQDERARALKWVKTGGVPPEERRFMGNAIVYRTMIIDEIHTIRNAETKAFAAACAVKATYRIGLSGTISRNTIGDWHSIIRFLRWSPWDNEEMFRYAFASIDLDSPAFSKKTGIAARLTKNNVQRRDLAKKQIIFEWTADTSNPPNEKPADPPSHSKKTNKPEETKSSRPVDEVAEEPTESSSPYLKNTKEPEGDASTGPIDEVPKGPIDDNSILEKAGETDVHTPSPTPDPEDPDTLLLAALHEDLGRIRKGYTT